MLTEQADPRYADIDRASVAELALLMNDADASVPTAIRGAMAAIVPAIEAVADRLARGGRLIYVGAGTAGRMGVLDASECPPTFGTPPSQVLGIIAGGPAAILAAQEGAEDDLAAGAQVIIDLDVDARDAVVGIAASGRTPFVIGAIRAARARGAATIALSCNVGAPVSQEAELPIEVPVGPEVLAGSTRLKAGTAQKLVLNMISTIAMVRLGKTFGNLMVDLRATNEKLRERAIRIVQAVTGADRGVAEDALLAADWEVKPAILMHRARHGCGRGSPTTGPSMADFGIVTGGGCMKVLGMISGTSHDGIDVAIVDFHARGRHAPRQIAALRQRALRAIGSRRALVRTLPPAELRYADVCELDTHIGQAFAEVAADAIAASGPVDLICSHGQTVFHWVEGAHALGTLQLGEPAWIAERTGVPVVADVRARDITVGGHGAPLVSLMDVLLLGDLPGDPAALNLGGISNMTVLHATRVVPSRMTSDHRMRSSTRRSVTRPGASRDTTRVAVLGASGRVDAGGAGGAAARSRTTRCRSRARPARSCSTTRTWRRSWRAFRTCRDADLVATLTALTARTVAEAVARRRAWTPSSAPVADATTRP